MIEIRNRYKIDNERLLESILENLTGKKYKLNSIARFIDDYFPTTAFYCTYECFPKKQEDPTCDSVWFDTNVKNEKGEQIFIVLFKNNEGKYINAKIGSIRALISAITAMRPKKNAKIRRNVCRFIPVYESVKSKRDIKEKPLNDIQDNEIKESKEIDNNISNIMIENESQLNANVSPIANALFENLLFSPWKFPGGLEKFLKISGCQIKNLISANRVQYYAKNDSNGIIINTGLIDKFGQPVHVYYCYNFSEEKYEATKLISSKADWLNFGFKKEQTEEELKPLTFYNKTSSVKDFHPELKQFDINFSALSHIVDERRNRFPESYRTLPANAIAAKVLKELELGLKILQVDRSYAKPIFSTSIQDVSWLLPLRCNVGFNERPELVLVIRKNANFYEIKTVLKYSADVVDRIRCVAPYGNIW